MTQESNHMELHSLNIELEELEPQPVILSRTNPAQPSPSLIKNICYPQLFRVKSKAINHGIKNESKAIDAYKSLMSANHKDFALEKCGVFIDKQHPWMHATPDFLSSCSCCGKGCGEVKCPYSIDDCDFDSYTAKKVLVWKKSMEKFGSKEITSTTIKYNNNCALLVDNFVTLLRVYLIIIIIIIFNTYIALFL